VSAYITRISVLCSIFAIISPPKKNLLPNPTGLALGQLPGQISQGQQFSLFPQLGFEFW
jgi:hypothetical protein